MKSFFIQTQNTRKCF